VLDDAVIDDDVVIDPLLRRARRLTHAEAAAAEIMQVGMHDCRIRATIPEKNRVAFRRGYWTNETSIFRPGIS